MTHLEFRLSTYVKLTFTSIEFYPITPCVHLQVLECGVCEDVFSLQGDKVPRLLLCGHTVCHDCLTRLPLHGRAVRCPFDRQVTELGKSDGVCVVFLQYLCKFFPFTC